MIPEKIIYLAHPLSAPDRSGIYANLVKATTWFRYFLLQHNVSVVADWILISSFLDDNDPEHRAIGMNSNKAILPLCDEVWLCGGRFSNGMKEEAALAFEYNIPVRSFLHLRETSPETFMEGFLCTWKAGEIFVA